MKKQTKSAVNAGFVQGAAILGIAGLLVKIIGAVYRIPLANIVGESLSLIHISEPTRH